ncbi:hypothetical protein LLEC1_06821 [Akanthomyces lecanii]|uniref:Uncharacterized protein n=1 Tax=Cordyceps confragosa TaxID=2714763 RepID=A0A179IMJ0_CORDF|nr:hypothetical protein LLEC1_06821 [Akanthomyces lecanii]
MVSRLLTYTPNWSEFTQSSPFPSAFESPVSMALFPLEVDESARRPRPAPQKALVLGVGLAMSIVYFWGPFAILAAANDAPPPRELLGLAAIVFILVFFLQIFLLYRLLSQTRLCPALTDPTDAFFYESRMGSAVLLFLCVPWFLLGAYALFISLFLATETVAQYLDPKNHKDATVSLGPLSALIMVTTPMALVTGIWWVSRTALRSLYRVLRSNTGRGQYEGVPLGLVEPRPDEQRFRQSMHAGMRFGGRTTAILGFVPTPSWLRRW